MSSLHYSYVSPFVIKRQHLNACRLQCFHLVLSGCILLSLSAKAQGLQWLAGGHAGDITAVAYAPSGQVIASASDDSTVKLWSTNGVLLRTLSVYPRQATAMAFSPNGMKLAIGTYHGTFNEGRGSVELWQSPDGWQPSSDISLQRTTTPHLGKVTALAFSADSTRLASGGAEGSNVVQQVSNGTVLRRLASYNTAAGSSSRPSAVSSLAFSSGGLLASGCQDKTIRVWNASWSQIWSSTSAHSSNVTAVAFSSDGSLLASGGLDGTVKIRSTSGWSVIRTLSGHAAGVRSVAFSGNGILLGSGSDDHTARLWYVSDGSTLAILNGHSAEVTRVSFSPDGTVFTSGGMDNCIKTWSTLNGLPVADFCPQTGMIRLIICAPDGRTVATVTDDRKINLWGVSDGTLLHTLEGHSNWVSAVAFSPDGQILASAGDHSMALWQVASGTELLRIMAGSNGVTSVAFSPDGSMLASGGDATDQTIQLWDPATGTLLRTLAGHTSGVTALSFSPDGSMLASGGRRFDNAVKLWDPTTGSLVRSLIGVSNKVECLAFSPDGGTIAAGGNGDGLIQLWNVSTGARQTFGSGNSPVFALAFSPDGGMLASTGEDRINFLDVASGTTSHIWTQEAGHVSCFSYSPNGNLLAYGRTDAAAVVAVNPWSVIGQPPLLFSGIVFESGGGALIEGICQPGTRYLIQRSDNLQDWDDMGITMSATDWMQWIDPDADNAPKRFYRALTLP